MVIFGLGCSTPLIKLQFTCRINSEYRFYDISSEVILDSITAVRLWFDVRQERCRHTRGLILTADTGL